MMEDARKISIDRFEDNRADRSLEHRLEQFDQDDETGAE